jgi:hypothetical protein
MTNHRLLSLGRRLLRSAAAYLAVGTVGVQLACNEAPRAPTGPLIQSRPSLSSDEAPARVGDALDKGASSASASLAPLFSISGASSGLATLNLSAGVSAADLAQNLAGAGVSISNVAYKGMGISAGRFSGGSGIIGFEEGIILSSGSIANVVGPNQSGSITVATGMSGDGQLDALTGKTTFDATVLEFFFVPDGDKVFFEYVFASDEYNEWVHTQFDDVFAFFVNGVNCAEVSNNTRVSINTINGGNPFGSGNAVNQHLYRNNEDGSINTEMDGLTTVLVCEASVTPGVPNHMKLAIADASDQAYDSDVFIKAGSFSTTPPPSVNSPPAANAGPDQTLLATSAAGASVLLEGSGSDVDGTIVSWQWSNGIGVALSGPTLPIQPLSIVLPKGAHTFTLTVHDDKGASGSDDVTIVVLNNPPVANAGPDQMGLHAIECTSPMGAQASLDGAASSDVDGTIASYQWYKGSDQIAAGASAAPTLALGNHVVSLKVIDDDGAESMDDVSIEVVDRTAPSVSLSASPGALWAPNHKYVQIAVLASASDACDANLSLSGSVVSSEPDEDQTGDGSTSGDIRVTRADGSVLLSSDASPAVAFNPAAGDQLELRAERKGDGASRSYTIMFRAVDASGNATMRTATVVVPHDQASK